METDLVRDFPIPHDFADGYQPAFWRRPEAYLDARIRAASSTFATLPGHVVDAATRRLEADLASGAWARRHHDLLGLEAVDYGYRLVVAGTGEGEAGHDDPALRAKVSSRRRPDRP